MHSRRHFIQSGTALLAAAAAGPLLAQSEAPAKKRPLRKAIMFGTVGVPGSILQKFQAIQAAGFEGVEPMSNHNPDEILRARDATGLSLPSVCISNHWAMPLSHPSANTRAATVRDLETGLRNAKRYGSTSVLLVPAVVNAQISYADAWTRSTEEIRKVVPLAEELGVKIAIENVWNNFLLSPLEAARYVDQFNSSAVAWHFDIGNVIHYGWPEHWIRVLGKRIVMLHIKEFSRKKADARGKSAGFDVEFLDGDNNWPEVMKALDEIGYSGWGIAEQPGGGTPEGLKNLSERMDRIFAS